MFRLHLDAKVMVIVAWKAQPALGVMEAPKVSLSGRSFCGFRAAKDLPPLSLLGNCRPPISGPVRTIDLPDDELAAVTAAIRRAIEDDRFPRAPRLDALKAALGRLEAAAEPTAQPKAPTPAKADKARR